MRPTQRLLCPLLACVLQPAVASVEHHFSTIQSDPNALYAFFKEMPKGGELHYHLDGGAYPEVMLSLGLDGDYCLQLKTKSINKITPCDGMPIKELVTKQDLYDEIIQAWSMKNFVPGQESAAHHFFTSFSKYTPLMADFRPQLLADAIKRASNQHELYLEIMVSPDNANATTFAPLASGPIGFAAKKNALLANKNFEANIANTVKESQRILEEARLELGCDTAPTQNKCLLVVKFQYYILREQPLESFFAQALNGFAAASLSNDIVGVNLVQAEDGILSLKDYREQMRIFKFLHQAYPNVHISLHAGELAPTDVIPSELGFHIHEAIFTGKAERIGHGVSIGYEENASKLLKHMATTPIPVEINLTSNRLLLNVFGKNHPLHYYLNNNVPVTLSTDDEGALRTDLTREYVAAAYEHGLDYPTIKTINQNALTYSFLPGKSLWTNPKKHLRVPECQNLDSSACQKFLDENEKAKLQWQLEKNLTAFELTYEK